MVNLGKQIPNAIYYPKTIAKGDFAINTTQSWATALTSVQAVVGQYTTIGLFQVGYRQFATFGVGGVTDGGRDDRRTATIKVYTASGQLTAGSLRIAISDFNSLNVTPLQDDLLSNWSAGVKVGEMTVIAGFQSYLRLMVNPTSTTSIDLTNASTQADVPISLYVQ